MFWPWASANDSGDHFRLRSAAVVQIQRSAHLLEAVSLERLQNFFDPGSSGAGEGVDELCPDAPIVQGQFVVVDGRAEFA